MYLRRVAGLMTLLGAIAVLVSTVVPLYSSLQIPGLDPRRIDFRFPPSAWLWPLITTAFQAGILGIGAILLLTNRAGRIAIGLIIGISIGFTLPILEVVLGPSPVGIGPAGWSLVAAGMLGLSGGLLALASLRQPPRPATDASAFPPPPAETPSHLNEGQVR